MKKNFLLFISLVLLAMQGWATPVDTLGTHLTRLDSIHQWQKFELSDSLIPFDGFVRPEFNPNEFVNARFDPDNIKPYVPYYPCNAGYEGVVWKGSKYEYMKFFYGCSGSLDTEDLLGVDTVFYLKAYQGNLCAPLTIEMIQGQGVFDFQKTTIYPWDLIPVDETFMYPEWGWSKWCGKTMTIGFHPTSVGTYTAKFKICGGSSNVEKVFSLTRTVVEELSKPSIHITPSTIKTFECEAGKPDTQSFIVTAKNLTESLSVTIEDDLDWVDMGPFLSGKDNEKQANGRFRFKILGRETEGTEGYEIEKTIISAEEAAQGAILKISYNPTTEGGYDQAKAVISGDGLYNEIHLRGYSSASQIQVSDNLLQFDAMKYGTDEKSFTINGSDLTNDSIHLDLTGDMFFIWWDSYPASMVEQGVTVWVKYEPTECGMHEGTITISGGGAIESKTVHLIGSTPGDPSLTVTPSSYNFETINLGDSRQQTFTVKGNNLNERISITPMETIGGDYSFTPEYLPSTGGDVTITYKPINTGSTGAVFTLSSGDVSTTIDVVGTCAIPPTITRSVTSLNFGTVINGQTVDTTFTVTGTNLTGDLTLSSSYSYFTVSPSIITAADAANGKTVTVTYKPTASGTHNGTITISGGGAESKTVGLMGTCMDPNIYVSNTSLNFGTVNTGSQSDPMTFTVRGSDLTGDLTITKTGSNCSISVSPTIITANKAANGATVTVTCTPTNAGSFSGTITVSGGGSAPKTVTLSGNAVNPPTFSVNKTSLDFETVKKGEEKPMYFRVTGSDLTDNLTVSSNSSLFTVSPATITPSEAKAGRTVTVKYKPTASGTHNGSITISGEGVPNKTVNLTGTCIDPNIYVSKTSLNFGTVKAGSPSDAMTFTVRGSDLTGDLTITKTGSNCSISVSPTIITANKAASGATVTVKCTPTNAGSFSGTITISGGEAEPKTVSVSGKCAAISANPSSYNFGNVAVGKPVTKDIIITGTNVTSSITISVEETEGGQFTINKNTLPASGGIVTVTFKATDAKTFGAALRISGGSAEAVSVSLTGKGVTPTITRNKSELDFSGSEITSDYVKITGTNLDDVISLEVTGSGRTHFILSTSTISISDAASGKQVKVTCNPKNASSADATLKISSPYATTKYVTLKYRKGTSGGGETQICSVEPEGGNEGGNDEFNNEFMEGGSLEVMSTSTTDVDELAMNSKVYAEGQSIIIESPVEQSAIISDISGHAQSVNLNIGRNEIPVNASGIYIVRIREKTTKLMLK